MSTPTPYQPILLVNHIANKGHPLEHSPSWMLNSPRFAQNSRIVSPANDGTKLPNCSIGEDPYSYPPITAHMGG